MPDKSKQQHKDPQVERFLADHPEYTPFFEEYPVPQSNLRENPYYSNYENFVDRQTPYLQDKAELTYMSDLLNKELERKYPKEFQKLTSEYGWNPDKPTSPQTRIKGADTFAKSNPNFFLTPDEQKGILGDKYNRYVGLRGKFGQELNLTGENEDANKPESWKVGARHAVAFNPVQANLEVSPRDESVKNKDVSNFSRYEQYDPQKGFTGYTKFSNIDPENPQENVSDVYARRLTKVGTEYDQSDRTTIDGKVVFKDPGRHFYKYYDDGSKEEINDNMYQTLSMFNSLPGHLKNKYIEESKAPKEDKQMASKITYANNKSKM